MRAGEEQRQRETQNLKQASGSKLSAQSPTRSSNPWTMRSWPEPKLDTTNWATQAPLFIYFFNVYLFLRETETEHKRVRGGERGRHRIRSRLQALSCQHRAQRRGGPTNHEIMTWAKIRHLTNWATQALLAWFSYLGFYFFLTFTYQCVTKF